MPQLEHTRWLEAEMNGWCECMGRVGGGVTLSIVGDVCLSGKMDNMAAHLGNEPPR